MTTILLRRGTSAEWASKNPVLGAGELGVDLTQGKMKLGDGATPWSSLSFVTSGGGGSGGSGGNWGSITGDLSSQADLQLALDGKQDVGSYADATHTHVISDVTGLQTVLDGKSETSHTHTASQITDLGDNLKIFIQDTTPTAIGVYLWINTAGGNLQFMVEDGL